MLDGLEGPVNLVRVKDESIFLPKENQQKERRSLDNGGLPLPPGLVPQVGHEMIHCREESPVIGGAHEHSPAAAEGLLHGDGLVLAAQVDEGYAGTALLLR